LNFSAHLFPPYWSWAFVALCLLVGARISLRAPWRRLKQAARLNIWLGTIVALTLLWSIHAGLGPGLGFHLLGSTACTLMFGPQLAMAAMALVMAGSAAAGSLEWASLPVNLLVMGVTPVLISQAVLRLVEKRLPSHVFVYIFGAAFFGAAVAMIGTGCMASLLLALAQVYAPEHLLAEYLPWYLLMAWAEAFTTGAAITLMVVYRPDWVVSFDDLRYLRNR
jgi:uncharacterized membrane protein